MGLMGLMFFLQGMGPGFYIPSLTNLLISKGLSSEMIQWAWLSAPIGALLSPVLVGALADNRFSSERVMGFLGFGSSAMTFAAFYALEHGSPAWVFVVLMFGIAIIFAPMWSMLASVSLANLKDSDREFPIVRLGGTAGWFMAGLMISFVLNSDASVAGGYAAAGIRALSGICTFFLPKTPPPGASRSLRSLLGLNAFGLLKERDHCVFFVVSALLSIPLAAFFMWTPTHLAELGDTKPSASMALGQVSEVLAMLAMVSLIRRFRLKTMLAAALILSALRYALFTWSAMVDSRTGLLIGISLHGMCYTFYFITGQMFLNRRVPAEMRSQAQGLLSLFSNGIGALVGTVAVRMLYDQTVANGEGGWAVYWAILTGMIVAITVGFLLSYRGEKVDDASASSP